MLRRFRLYFIGFGIGLLVVYVVFLRDNERDLDFWTPSQRMLEDLRNDSAFHESAALRCFSECLSLDSAELASLWKDSKVKSLHPGGDPYRYLITLETAADHLEATVEKRGETHKLVALKSYTNPLSCPCSDEH